MKSRFLSLAAALLLVAACAATPPVAVNFDNLVGVSERTLVQELGPPDNVYVLSDTRFLTYHLAGSAASGVRCKAVFELKNAEVMAWRSVGSGCRT